MYPAAEPKGGKPPFRFQPPKKEKMGRAVTGLEGFDSLTWLAVFSSRHGYSNSP